ncbi:MAG: sensor histidine kinase [Lachnospiraceae bacterium]
MTAGKYLHDKILVLLLNGLGLLLLSVYLLAMGDSLTTVSLITVVWLVVCSVVFYLDYRNRKRYFERIEDLMENLDQPYLVQEFLGGSWKFQDQLYQEILHRSNKAVIEKIYQLEETQREYKEFIETWIHEVKLPITGMRLVCHNELKTGNHRVETYLTEMDNAVEQALFYARSEQVYKDYQVAETDLKQVVLRIVSKNKYLLIENQMNVQVECENDRVMTDRKWLEFILTQVLINAVKYKKSGSGEIVFRSEQTRDGTKLIVRDDGIGIPEEEVERIFEKGFTGSNGRNREKSTGIGLYLCRRLCRKLAIEIGVNSVEHKYTEIYFFFPRNSYLSKL